VPTVIDSLVLELNLDTSQFTASQRAAMDDLRRFEISSVTSGREIESQTKRMVDMLSTFRRVALTAVGAFLGGRGLVEFADYVTSLDAATSRLGRTMGMATADVSVWQGAIRQAGGTAEGANAALQGLSGEMSRFQLTGQSQMLPILSRLGVSLYDQNRNLKTSGQLWLDLAEAVQGLDPRQATAFLQMIPGANQDMINFALLGRHAMEGYLTASRQAGAATEQSARQAQEYRRQLDLLDQSATSVGRTMFNIVAPSLTSVFNGISRLIQAMQSGEVYGAQARATGRDSGYNFGRSIIRWVVGEKAEEEIYGPRNQSPEDIAKKNLAVQMRAAGALASANSGSVPEMESYIRSAATARGIDPDTAVAVARSEGLYSYIGDQGSSFGPYQLHYGGVAGGANSVSGLGDTFTKQTGLNARDPGTWKAQVDFSLDEAKKGGWGPWHGWRGAPFAGIGGGPGGGKATTINVGGVTVNTSSGNGDGIARDIDGALKRSLSAGAANYGPQ
jgi:hypothetical protein